MRIVFYGTPKIAAYSLSHLIKTNYNVVAVVTAPDRPAGRGYELRQSDVKKVAIENNISVLQPTNMKSDQFLQQLKELNPDLQIVLAFRMMPQQVWSLPKHGTINLHASLLPQYRGAAPINWAIINGEKTSGITTFYINQKIDTGNILLQQEIVIEDNDTAGTLHDKMMVAGAQLIVRTIEGINDNELVSEKQAHGEVLREAPKLNKQNCLVDFNKSAAEVRNHIRGLNPYPAAYCHVVLPDGTHKMIKLFNAEITQIKSELANNCRINNTELLISSKDYWVKITELQFEGKKRMMTSDFIRGFKHDNLNIKV